MLNIDIKLVGIYRSIAGTPDLNLDIADLTDGRPTDIYDLVKTVSEKYGQEFIDLIYTDTGQIDDWSRVMINGDDIRFIDEKDRILKDGDKVHIFSMSGGG